MLSPNALSPLYKLLRDAIILDILNVNFKSSVYKCVLPCFRLVLPVNLICNSGFTVHTERKVEIQLGFNANDDG